MKQLKLEVGKTYRSREGEEVKIIRKSNTGKYPFRGSNGVSYTESGRFEVYIENSWKDLIAEAPSETTRHTFSIPDGVKKVTVEEVGNRIVVEMAPEDVETPKAGDVMINNKGNIYIFKSIVIDIHKHFAWFGKDGRLVIGSMCNPGRPATPEEAQPLFDALKKAGKRWNTETMQVEEIPESTRICVWVEEHLKGGFYTQDDISEVIGNYLKHKEGEK